MDEIDEKLLRALQTDSRRRLQEIADEVALSTSACHRRQRLLEESGVIEGYGARLDPDKLGLALNVFVEISLNSQSQDCLQDFEAAVLRADEILECHLMSGEADYRLRVAAKDMRDFDRLHRERLSRLPGVASMKSSFVIRVIKPWRGYPVAVAGR